MSTYLRFTVITQIILSAMTANATAQWQQMCQDGQWVADGLGYRCVPNQSQPIPQFQPHYSPPPQENTINNAITNELSWLGSLIRNRAPLQQNIPLSGGLVMMQNAVAPPPAPSGYRDPFGTPQATTPPPPSPSSGPVQLNPGLSSNAVQLQPPSPAPSQPSVASKVWNYFFPNPNNCTFSSC
jgi:hypothetical protein